MNDNLGRVRLFVYGTALTGEPDHQHLIAARATLIGVSQTAPGYSLVEIGPLAALVEEGNGTVTGEVFELDRQRLFNLLRGLDPHGIYQVRSVRLSDGTTVDTFILPVDQARGKRRIKNGDWRARFAAAPQPFRRGPMFPLRRN